MAAGEITTVGRRTGAKHRVASARSVTALSDTVSIYWLSCLVVLLTFTLNPATLEPFMHYSVSGGNFFEKFHPASYVSVLLLVMTFLGRGDKPVELDRHTLIFLGLFLCLMIFLAIKGVGASASAIFDVLVAPAMLALALHRLDVEKVQKICQLFVWIAFANALFVMIDYVRESYTLPVVKFALHEEFFRPAGFAGHPTQAAMMSQFALFFVLLGVARGNLRRLLSLFFLFAVALCKVRTPFAIAGILVFVNLLYPFVPRANRWDRIVDIGMVMIVPAVVAIAYLSGAFDRFLALGVWDQSTQSRFSIYDTLSYLSEEQFLNGISGDVGNFLTLKATNGEYVESSFIIAVFAGGFPFACALAATIGGFYWPLMKKDILFAGLTIVIVTTGNGFIVKNMEPAALLLLSQYLLRRKELGAFARRKIVRTARPVALGGSAGG